LKIKELVEQRQASKETVHYYIREGLLPNLANWEGTSLTMMRDTSTHPSDKGTPDDYFYPLLIKNILKFQKKSPEGNTYLNLSRNYFRPVDRLLPSEIPGEPEFREATGIGKKWLDKMEEWKIITPEVRAGQKVYSQDDITIGKLIVEMDEKGLGPKDGFDPEAPRHYRKYS
jgi:hypothetical protein